VIRGFAEATRSHGARLVFVFFDEPYDVYASYLATHSGRTLADVRAEIAASHARLRTILDRHDVRWLDDVHLIADARVMLKSGQKLEVMPCFAPKRAAMLAVVQDSDPERPLAAEDEVHYSWLANVLVSQWLYRELMADPGTRAGASPDPWPGPSVLRAPGVAP